MLFPVHIVKQDDGDYRITAPDVPGCSGQSDNLNAAIGELQAAIELTIEARAMAGGTIPVAGTIEDYLDHPDYQDSVWAVIDVDINKFSGKAVKLNITLPQYLLTRIDHAVKHSPDWSSRSGFLAETAIKALS